MKKIRITCLITGHSRITEGDLNVDELNVLNKHVQYEEVIEEKYELTEYQLGCLIAYYTGHEVDGVRGSLRALSLMR